ncbi:uncharacterized protein LOC100372511 [Saccoglossus kowalevskii]
MAALSKTAFNVFLVVMFLGISVSYLAYSIVVEPESFMFSYLAMTASSGKVSEIFNLPHSVASILMPKVDVSELESNKTITISTSETQEQLGPQYTSIRKGYLLPIHHYGSGPNFNFEHFRTATLFALYTNRTIVEKWFHTHRSQNSDTMGWKFLNETFDVNKLRKIVAVASIDEFKSKCNNTANTVIALASNRVDVEEMYQKHVELYEKEYGIFMQDWSQITVTANPKDVFNSLKNVGCVGIYMPRDFDSFKFPERSELLKQIDMHLIRPQRVREMAIAVNKVIFHNQPYMAVHFRTKTEEGCRGNYTNCDPDRVAAMKRSAISVSEDFHTLMSKRNISALYMALPNYAMHYKQIFQKKIPNVVTAEDIAALPSIAPVKDDNYVMSLVEQELCIRAELFIGWVYSYWSQMVIMQRDLYSKESLGISKLPGWDTEGFHLVKRK